MIGIPDVEDILKSAIGRVSGLIKRNPKKRPELTRAIMHMERAIAEVEGIEIEGEEWEEGHEESATSLSSGGS